MAVSNIKVYNVVMELQQVVPYALYVPHSGHYMYRTVVTICTASLTFNNSTFRPHTVFMLFCVDLRTNSDYFPIQH